VKRKQGSWNWFAVIALRYRVDFFSVCCRI